jgi:hypothetical protein
MSKKNNKPREKSERVLLEDIRRLLILIAVKGKATQKDVGKCLGVRNTQINNILMGVGAKENGQKQIKKRDN